MARDGCLGGFVAHSQALAVRHSSGWLLPDVPLPPSPPSADALSVCKFTTPIIALSGVGMGGPAGRWCAVSTASTPSLCQQPRVWLSAVQALPQLAGWHLEIVAASGLDLAATRLRLRTDALTTACPTRRRLRDRRGDLAHRPLAHPQHPAGDRHRPGHRHPGAPRHLAPGHAAPRAGGKGEERQ